MEKPAPTQIDTEPLNRLGVSALKGTVMRPASRCLKTATRFARHNVCPVAGRRERQRAARLTGVCPSFCPYSCPCGEYGYA